MPSERGAKGRGGAPQIRQVPILGCLSPTHTAVGMKGPASQQRRQPPHPTRSSQPCALMTWGPAGEPDEHPCTGHTVLSHQVYDGTAGVPRQQGRKPHKECLTMMISHQMIIFFMLTLDRGFLTKCRQVGSLLPVWERHHSFGKVKGKYRGGGCI